MIPQRIQAEFITSLTGPRDFEGRGLPEVVLVGRSNVGKSSLINKLAGRTKLARTSSQPGMTRVINIYRLQEALNLVDLPGYGYAKVSKTMREDWGGMIDGFLNGSGNIRHVFQIVDARHEPSRLDVQMAQYLHAKKMDFTVIATKADKMGRDTMRFTMPIGRALAVQPWQIVPFSATSGVGREKVWEILCGFMGAGDADGSAEPVADSASNDVHTDDMDAVVGEDGMARDHSDM